MKNFEGILLVDKPTGCTSFSLIPYLRKLSGIKKIGHCGTLDPFASGLMIFLLGKPYTVKSAEFLNQDKDYQATVHLGITTDTYDRDGKIITSSENIPTLAEIEAALTLFQGEVHQTPPMYSAKKVKGKKLYELARRGITIERKEVKIHLKTQLISYQYPFIELHITCSKGAYVRTLAHDLGTQLGCGGHLSELVRLRIGPFQLHECVSKELLFDPSFVLTDHLKS